MKTRNGRNRIKQLVTSDSAPEKIPLNKQQVAQILSTQQALQVAQMAATAATDGVLAAAGIEPGTVRIVGGHVGANPHLLILRSGDLARTVVGEGDGT